MGRSRRLRPLRAFLGGKDAFGVYLPLKARIKGRVRGCDGRASVGASGPFAVSADPPAENLSRSYVAFLLLANCRGGP